MNGILKKLLLVAGTATITISLLHFTGEENIERIKDKVSSMKSKIVTISNDRNQILNKLQNTINQYNNDIKLLNEKKAELENKLNNLSQTDKAHVDELDDLKRQINDLTQEKIEKDSLIASLRDEITQLNNEITVLNDKIALLNKEIEKANKAVEDLEVFVNNEFNSIDNINTETDLSTYNPNVSPDFSDNSSNDSNSSAETANTWKLSDSHTLVVKNMLTLRQAGPTNSQLLTASLPDSATNININLRITYKGISQVNEYQLTDLRDDFFLNYGREIDKIEITGSCTLSGTIHSFNEVISVDYTNN